MTLLRNFGVMQYLWFPIVELCQDFDAGFGYKFTFPNMSDGLVEVLRSYDNQYYCEVVMEKRCRAMYKSYHGRRHPLNSGDQGVGGTHHGNPEFSLKGTVFP
jgi:hypothetical protein